MGSHRYICVGTIKYVGDIVGHMGPCLNFWSIFYIRLSPENEFLNIYMLQELDLSS